MKIHSKDYRVAPDKKLDLSQWPTVGPTPTHSKKQYQKLLEEHVQELSTLAGASLRIQHATRFC